MSEGVIDLIVVSPETDDEDWGFYSPQVPGLVGGRDSLLQLSTDLPEILRFAEVALPVRVRMHVEHLYETNGVNYIIRVAEDEHRAERLIAAARLRAALVDDGQRQELLSSPPTRTGEVLFIGAVATDVVEDLAAQLHPSGDAAVVVCNLGDQLIWTFHFTNAEDLDEAARPLDELGLSGGMTIGEIMGRNPTTNNLALLAA
jgi:hypothetical protein